MIKIGSQPCLAAGGSRGRFFHGTQWFTTLLALALLLPASLQAAEAPDTHYLRIFSIIDKADTLNASGNTSQAKSKYQEAHQELLKLKQENPVWNTKVVTYRLKYVREKIDELSKPPPSVAATETETTSASVGAAAADSETEIKLLDAGAEPRRVLRIQAKPGDKQSLGMTMKIAMDMEMAGMPAQAIKMPAMKLDMELTVKEVSNDGDITYETVIGDASVVDESGVMPQVADAMKASFGNIKGLSGTGTITSRGFGKKADLKPPSGADPQVRQAMEQMSESFSRFALGFPEEAVGTGARWEVKLPLKSQGMTISQTTTYELASIEGDELDLKTTLVQKAANQKIQNPAVPGLKMDLTKMTGTGSGTASINLAQILPSQAKMDSKSEIAMAMNMAGQKQTMTMKMDIRLLLESK